MTKKAAFCWGAVGALAPEIVRLFKVISAAQPLPNIQWPVYAVLLLLFCVLGGAVSIAWKPDAEWKALWVGVSLPTIIESLVQKIPQTPQ